MRGAVGDGAGAGAVVAREYVLDKHRKGCQTVRSWKCMKLLLPPVPGLNAVARVGKWLVHVPPQVYESHLAEVRRVVPPSRLLEFSPRDGWAPLCAFLGVPLPPEGEPFPHVNDTEEFGRYIESVSGRGLPRRVVCWACSSVALLQHLVPRPEVSLRLQHPASHQMTSKQWWCRGGALWCVARCALCHAHILYHCTVPHTGCPACRQDAQG